MARKDNLHTDENIYIYVNIKNNILKIKKYIILIYF